MRPRPLRRSAVAFALLAFVLPVLAGSALAGDERVRSRMYTGDAGSGPAPMLPRTPEEDTGIVWSDVPEDHWAVNAVAHVAGVNAWMRDYRQASDGTYPFRPERLESRRLFARAVVRAFAPEEQTDPAIAFPDLPDTDRFFRFANVAVRLGWMETDDAGNFLPAGPVTPRSVHRALVLAVGLSDAAAGLDALHMRNGATFETPDDFGALLLGMRLGLRYNHGDESLDVGPDTPLSRAEVAWSLYRASTMPSWMPSYLAPYATIELPNLGPKTQRIVRFGIRYVGYPYVWGGEWGEPTPAGYCCGAQPVGGFDCSGIVWWVLKAAEGGWDNTPPREYAGWSLPQRSSSDMARNGEKIQTFEELRPGDLVFYDGDENGVVDHVNTYIGNGWAIDSSSGSGGVTIMWVADGWYFDHFVHARRVIGVTN